MDYDWWLLAFMSIQQDMNYYSKSDVYKYIHVKEKYIYIHKNLRKRW